ncbi:hypothetical protein [Nostoc sp. C117]
MGFRKHWLKTQLKKLPLGVVIMARVIVIGAGLGGLPTAYELRHSIAV